ncbi:MAG: M18 family aminopeptidase [Propionibacteriales bacterium]|nr:M18 family aminopeptidase [Propionibacteriales bacterium]
MVPLSPQDTRASAEGLCRFVDASPSPFHVCATAAAELESHGFRRLEETSAWPTEPGRHYLVRGGSLVAWSTEPAAGPATPFRIIGAHTDSPNLRIKQRPDLSHAGWQQVAVEPYGGALLNSWLDRDLGLSGRVSVRSGDQVAERMLRVDRPILRVPQLAIHLDRDVNESLKLDPQNHLNPVWGLGTAPGSFVSFVADELGVNADDVFGWELMTHDLTPSRRIGREGELISAPRLDNQGTCYAGLCALLDAVEAFASAPAGRPASIPVLVLFDHEEVGSMSERGAFSDLLPVVLERIALAGGGTRDDYLRALAGSLCVSGDMSHATHPNYSDRHEPRHWIEVNGGPVLKVHLGLRYASDATGMAAFAMACERAKVPLQRYMHRADLACGSSVGPLTAARLGVTTVDVGAPQLAMHSAREMCGSEDPAMYAAALTAFLAPAG